MIALDCQQGSPEWHEARLGIPTASNFHKILSPTGKASTQAHTYMMKLLAEWLTGERDDEYTNDAMAIGSVTQPEATAYYELTTGRTVEPVGLCYLDDRRIIGSSPDGLVGDDSGIEIKCPLASTHVDTLLFGSMPPKHKPQVQGAIWITGRESWCFLSYHPRIEPVLHVIKRDEEYIELLSAAVEAFVAEMLKARAVLLKRGYKPAEREVAA